MLRGSEINGISILTHKGKNIDTVQELIYDPVIHVVLGFLIDEGGWTGGAQVLPWADVEHIDRHAVVTSAKDNVVPAAKVDAIRHVLENDHNLIGLNVYKSDRSKVGKVTDVFFDTQSGKIHAFIVSPEDLHVKLIKQLVIQAKALTLMQFGNRNVLLLSAMSQQQRLHDDIFAPIL